MSSKFTKFLEYVRGKSIAVAGMGVSNTPLIRLLLDSGALVTVCDKKEYSELDATLRDEFKARGAEFRTGKDYLKGLDHELIFKTPGMRPDMPELEAARGRGSIITSEMDVFMHVCPAHIIGVTGSDGKTTTTTVIYELLKAAGKTCYIGGNIGNPLLDRAGDMREDDWAVLELSSFQLMTMTRSPEISVITNLAPNHLDVHTSMQEYTDAKRNIYLYRPEGGRVVLNADNDVTRTLSDEVGADCILFSRREVLPDGVYCRDGEIIRGGRKILDCAGIKIPGMHNVENYMAAIAAVGDIVPDEVVRRVAAEFAGVVHRMELVREKDGVKYYNDSIASSPSRTIAGLRALDTKVILIAGGYDKEIPFDVLGPEAVKYVKRLILVGVTTPKIRAAVEKAEGYSPADMPIHECKTMDEAVMTASKYAVSGDIVTLSPACASFDLYVNFAARGEHYKELVNAL